jgi:hypothetical protein
MDMADHFGVPVIALIDTRAPIPASAPRNAARPRPSRARRKPACDRRAQCCGDHRRRRLGRRHRDRHRQPRDHAGARHLQRDLARGRGLDPVARHRQGAGGRLKHEDHRPGSAAFGVVDTIVPEPTGGAHRDPAAAIAATGDAIADALAELRVSTGNHRALAARESSWRSGARWPEGSGLPCHAGVATMLAVIGPGPGNCCERG